MTVDDRTILRTLAPRFEDDRDVAWNDLKGAARLAAQSALQIARS